MARSGWNGKGMFIFQRPSYECNVEQLLKFDSIPQNVKDYYVKQLGEISNSDILVIFTPYLCMKATDGNIVNGWLASQSDLLADDWNEFTV